MFCLLLSTLVWVRFELNCWLCGFGFVNGIVWYCLRVAFDAVRFGLSLMLVWWIAVLDCLLVCGFCVMRLVNWLTRLL